MTKQDTNNEEPLTDDELIHVRQIMEADTRARWLWSSIRTVAVWVAAVIAGTSLLLDSMASGLKHLIGKG